MTINELTVDTGIQDSEIAMALDCMSASANEANHLALKEPESTLNAAIGIGNFNQIT